MCPGFCSRDNVRASRFEATMNAASEFATKHARVAAWLGEHRADAVLLAAPANVAWLACGGEVERQHGPSAAIAASADRAFLLCGSEDADRLRQEEVRGLPLEIVPMLSTAPEALVERARGLLAQATRWKCDSAGLPLERDASFDGLRRVLLPEETERLVRLARDAAAALEEVAAECYRGILERDAAARLAAECLRRQIRPREILAGADERLENYTRPAPKATGAERALVLGLIGARGGLHVVLSRTLCLARPTTAFLEKFGQGLATAARLCQETRAGDTLGAVVQRALPQPPVHLAGLGGITGYAYPEHEARASSTWKLGSGQALVWSVASAGARTENTYVLGDAGLEIVTATEGWPRRSVRADGKSYDMPDLLQL
jgi:antitoxin VapB